MAADCTPGSRRAGRAGLPAAGFRAAGFRARAAGPAIRRFGHPVTEPSTERCRSSGARFVRRPFGHPVTEPRAEGASAQAWAPSVARSVTL